MCSETFRRRSLWRGQSMWEEMQFRVDFQIKPTLKMTLWSSAASLGMLADDLAGIFAESKAV